MYDNILLSKASHMAKSKVTGKDNGGGQGERGESKYLVNNDLLYHSWI